MQLIAMFISKININEKFADLTYKKTPFLNKNGVLLNLVEEIISILFVYILQMNMDTHFVHQQENPLY